MSNIVRIVRVFLASPGDLGEERQLVNEAIEEINKKIAPYLGFRVDLMGWEDTLSGSGRPQEIINKDLDLCDLFIGMLWRKWGTPPSKKGKFSSGFEEEYTLSLEKSENGGSPEIAIYLKDIDPELLNDPGDDLKKVLAFKKNLTEEKKILFQDFSQPEGLQKLVRLKLQDYLLELGKQEEKSEEIEQSQTKIINSKNDHRENDGEGGLFRLHCTALLLVLCMITYVDSKSSEVLSHSYLSEQLQPVFNRSNSLRLLGSATSPCPLITRF